MSVTYIRSKYLNNFPKEFQTDKEFNQEHFDYFMSNMDLRNAYEYASQFRYTGKSADLELENRKMLNRLRREASSLEYRTRNMTDEQRDAFSFVYAMDHDLTLPRTGAKGKVNKFTQDFQTTMNSLGGYGSSKLVINLKNNANNFFDFLSKDRPTTSKMFFDSLGITGNELEALYNLGAENVNNTNEGYSFTIDKSNPNVLKFLRAYSNKELNNNNIEIFGIDRKGKRVFTKDDSPITNAYQARTNPEVYHSQDTRTKLRDMFSKIDEARTLTNFEAMDAKQRRDQSTQREMILTGFMSPGHQRLEEDFAKGLVSPERYEKLHKIIESQVGNLIETAFTQNKVYYNDDKDDVLRYADNDIRQALENEFRSARENNKEVSWQTAIVGGRQGIYITLPPRISTTDWKSNGYAKPDSDASKTRKIFIPDVFKGEIEDMVYRNPKTRAVQELEEMDINKYDYEISGNRKIIPTGDGNFILRETKVLGKGATSWKDTPLDKFHAQQLIAEEMSYQDTAEMIKNSVANPDGTLDLNLVGLALVKYQDDIKASVMNLWQTNNPDLINDYSNSYIEKVCEILGVDINAVMGQLIDK